MFNHTNFNSPTDNFTLGARPTVVPGAQTNAQAIGNAGVLTSTATTSRQIQLGAKIVF